ncbi:MAG: hypothetical protein WC004_03070 [Candidatus Absconditabacterales bacterium]
MAIKGSQLKQEHLPIIKSLIPEHDPQYRTLRGYIDLCLLDSIMPFEAISAMPVFQTFIHKYSEQIMKEINLERQMNMHFHEVDSVHDNHYLSDIFSKLEDNALSTQKAEYVNIKLREASGMLEFPTKRSFADIQFFIQDLKLVKDPSKIIGGIKDHLRKEELYDNNGDKTYRVGLSLGSRKILSLSIEHDSQKSQQGFNGFRYELTNDRAKIINVMRQRGYFHDHIGEAIDMIVDKSEYDPDDDMDMAR